MSLSDTQFYQGRETSLETDLSEEYNNYVAIPPFEVNANPYILLANDDAPYLRRDHNQGTFVKRKSATVQQLLILDVLESFYKYICNFYIFT